MNLVLIGYRGTGKSAVARRLSERTGRRVVSIDSEIVARVNTSIPDYVACNGWDAFRDVEQDVVWQVAGQDNLIVDAGGGVVIRHANVEALRANGLVFWLTADPTTIVSRIQDDHNRPSLTGTKSFVEEVEEVLAERMPLYAGAAHHEVSTLGQTPSQVADAILALIGEQV